MKLNDYLALLISTIALGISLFGVVFEFRGLNAVPQDTSISVDMEGMLEVWPRFVLINTGSRDIVFHTLQVRGFSGPDNGNCGVGREVRFRSHELEDVLIVPPGEAGLVELDVNEFPISTGSYVLCISGVATDFSGDSIPVQQFKLGSFKIDSIRGVLNIATYRRERATQVLIARELSTVEFF